MSRLTLIFSISLAAISLNSLHAQTKKAVDPAFAQIQDQAGLPRVLLLGDSISIGYTLPVREELKAVANVHRPGENCSSTIVGLDKLTKWLGEKPFDVIHFNFGLHDLKYVLPGSETMVAVDTPKAHSQVSIEQYEQNLEKVVARLKATGAKLIWCTTTPVPEGAMGRKVADVERYNAVALKVMHKHSIAVDDLYAFALPKLAEIQQPKNVHFTQNGSQQLAKQVAASIRQLLGPSRK